ncbi:hypothetical protein [Xanthovirga aplysinae]|uniref:hypothetical protein n=1 Tax=Xanthovirga aplysinae TaxID=2529853 RepID=UPI0012BCB377|nr:hypothetical protein [Xanthovirga aplysinae]MTI32041.1 hypothetical protein [Xanthovirga aplysinae]
MRGFYLGVLLMLGAFGLLAQANNVIDTIVINNGNWNIFIHRIIQEDNNNVMKGIFTLEELAP